MTLDEFICKPGLHGICGGPDQYSAKCPAHDDHRASLSIARRDDGGILLNCHAGCTPEQITTSLGLAVHDLYNTTAAQVFGGKREVAIYRYIDAHGNKSEKVRYSDKSFTWRQDDGRGGYVFNRKGVEPSLYMTGWGDLPDTVYFVEGEKDVDNIMRAGFYAISVPDGAESKWKPQYTESLRARNVVVIQDNDAPGRKLARTAAKELTGTAKSVKILDLTCIWPGLPDHGDTSDLLSHMGPAEGMAAIQKHTAVLPEFTSDAADANSCRPALVKASDIPYEPPRWLISPYFQRGKGTLIQADSGAGKTAFMCAIAAHVSTGRPLLGIPIETPGNVLILSVEDDLPVLRGRIEANGGDLDKCHFMTNAAGLTFNSPEVEQAVKQINAKMLIFDPFQAFLGASVNMDKSNQTRPELAKLFEMSDRNDCSVAIIAHIGKFSAGNSAVNRSLGSVDIPAAMRSVLQIVKNPENDTERIAIHVKCSNAPKGRSVAYTIGDRGGIQWSGFSAMTEEDLNVIVKRTEKGVPYENEPLVRVFNQMLTDKPGGGFWPYEEVKSIGMKLLGFPPFSSTQDLKAKLNGTLTRELQERDGMIVTCGHKNNGFRGIKIEQYQHPVGYQTSFRVDEKRDDKS